jgi:hypothetical protein
MNIRHTILNYPTTSSILILLFIFCIIKISCSNTDKNNHKNIKIEYEEQKNDSLYIYSTNFKLITSFKDYDYRLSIINDQYVIKDGCCKVVFTSPKSITIISNKRLVNE